MRPEEIVAPQGLSSVTLSPARRRVTSQRFVACWFAPGTVTAKGGEQTGGRVSLGEIAIARAVPVPMLRHNNNGARSTVARGNSEASTEQRRNERTGETGDPRENPRRPAASSGAIPTRGHPGATPPVNEPLFAQAGGEQSNHHTAEASCRKRIPFYDLPQKPTISFPACGGSTSSHLQLWRRGTSRYWLAGSLGNKEGGRHRHLLAVHEPHKRRGVVRARVLHGTTHLCVTALEATRQTSCTTCVEAAIELPRIEHSVNLTSKEKSCSGVLASVKTVHSTLRKTVVNCQTDLFRRPFRNLAKDNLHNEFVLLCVHNQVLEPMSVKRGLVWSSAGMKGQGKRENPEKTRRPAVSSVTISTCDNPDEKGDGVALHWSEKGDGVALHWSEKGDGVALIEQVFLDNLLISVPPATARFSSHLPEPRLQNFHPRKIIFDFFEQELKRSCVELASKNSVTDSATCPNAIAWYTLFTVNRTLQQYGATGQDGVGTPFANQSLVTRVVNPAAQPVGNLLLHAVANQTQCPFPELRTVSWRMGTTT
ncbi:hypothetical protein PR048_028851 [Dryococelus australis]|uniref:Uncharacterized protein n=1 Tax=Dryococelus australis TaxID=614101 RepID=A0ABQ9GBQ8_9NEOP|nr:hypothetical protein PR048_028851 [Dryococelus australis]